MSTTTRLDPPPTPAEWAAEVAADEAASRPGEATHDVIPTHRRTRAQREAAIAAKRQQAATAARDAELAAERAVPSSGSGVDTDPTVAELEQRIVDGDTTVTAGQLEEARDNAKALGRFGSLRARAAERKAADDAKRAAEARRVANLDAAREALAPYTDDRLGDLYAAAVRAIEDLRSHVRDYNGTVVRLATLPKEQRPDGAVSGVEVPGGAHVKVDGRGYNPIDLEALVEQANRGVDLSGQGGTAA